MDAEKDLVAERFREIFGDGNLREAPAFTQIADYYDLLMSDVPYTAWIAYVEDVLSRLDPGFRCSRVLELASGTGTLSLEFARRGHSVLGVDLSRRMVEVARRKAKEEGLDDRAFFYCADMADFDPSPYGPFDLVICLFDSLNYITEPDRFQRLFFNVRTAVRKGGYFIFDLNSEYSLSHHLFDLNNLWKKRAPLYYYWKSTYDSVSRLCRIDMWFAYRTDKGFYRFKELHWQRSYSIDEVRKMCEKAGWDWVRIYEAYTFRKPEPTSERWYFVLRNP